MLKPLSANSVINLTSEVWLGLTSTVSFNIEISIKYFRVIWALEEVVTEERPKGHRGRVKGEESLLQRQMIFSGSVSLPGFWARLICLPGGPWDHLH